MSQSGELINATLQCIGDSSDNVHCTRTHQTIISDLVFRLHWHIWVHVLRHEGLCRIWRIRWLTNLTARTHLTFAIIAVTHCRGTQIIWLAVTRLKDHKKDDSSDCKDQGLDAKVALAPQGWRTSHVWWFCKVGSATAPRCWRRECFEPIDKLWRQKSD